MPVLPDERHEQYAKMRANGLVPAKAAVAAGYAVGSGTATKLEENPLIIQRVGELIQQFALEKEQRRAAAIESARVVGHNTGIGRSWIVQKLAENAQIAANDGDYKESNIALKLLGDHYGMWGGGGDPNHPTGDIPSTLDVDSIAKLTERLDSLKPPPLPPIDTKRAMEIIGKIDPKDRKMNMNTETAVAFKGNIETDVDADDIIDSEEDTSDGE